MNLTDENKIISSKNKALEIGKNIILYLKNSQVYFTKK